MNARVFMFILLGVALVFTAKYLLVGLEQWDRWFHPARSEGGSSVFDQPLLGLFKART